jgi:hypothetical protein
VLTMRDRVADMQVQRAVQTTYTPKTVRRPRMYDKTSLYAGR